MDDQLLAQLDRRIDEHHQCLCQRLDDLTQAIQSTHAALSARLEAHEAYHRANEHRFGLPRLAERYPFRLAALAFTAAWALLASSSATAHHAGAWIRKLLGAVFQ